MLPSIQVKLPQASTESIPVDGCVMVRSKVTILSQPSAAVSKMVAVSVSEKYVFPSIHV